MDRSWHHNDQLGVHKKIGKNIKKSPLHQPDFSYGIGIASARPQRQPQVGENDFRSLPQQKIRPPALTQINWPHDPPRVVAQQPTHDLVFRPPTQPYMHQGSQPMTGHGAESSVSVYMRYLQSSLGDSGPNGNQMQSSQPHEPPETHDHRSPRFNGDARDRPILPTPRFNSPPQQMYNNSLHTPRFNGRGILPTPTSQYLLQSPSISSRNLLSPRPPYLLLSPGVQYPPPLTPRGSTFSSIDQPGILGPGTIPQPPASPGLVFPPSPFPISCPRYR